MRGCGVAGQPAGRTPHAARVSGELEEAATATRERVMLELRHRGGGPGPGGVVTPPPLEGEAAGGDHETESTSDKVSRAARGAHSRPAGSRFRPAHLERRWCPHCAR